MVNQNHETRERKGSWLGKRVTLGTFLKQFSTEAACQAYLADQRRKSGYVCPKCGNRQGYRLGNERYQCAQCRHQVSVMSGTALHKTNMPLTKWFSAFCLVRQDKRGIFAGQLSSQVGTTYKSAWYILKRTREAMGQRDETHRLDGVIDFDN